jgi:hypothetical protein
MCCCFAVNRRGAQQLDITHLSRKCDFRRAWSFVLFMGLSYDDVSLI